jgi:hypothetical protein
VIADAVGEDPLGRKLDDVVGEELEGEQALPARHDDQRRFFHPAADDAHALPRVLAEIAHADVEHRAADEIDRLEAGAVEPRRQFRHHRGGHPGRPQALMRVAQRHVDELDCPVRHYCAICCSTHRVWTLPPANSGRAIRRS